MTPTLLPERRTTSFCGSSAKKHLRGISAGMDPAGLSTSCPLCSPVSGQGKDLLPERESPAHPLARGGPDPTTVQDFIYWKK